MTTTQVQEDHIKCEDTREMFYGFMVSPTLDDDCRARQLSFIGLGKKSEK